MHCAPVKSVWRRRKKKNACELDNFTIRIQVTTILHAKTDENFVNSFILIRAFNVHLCQHLCRIALFNVTIVYSTFDTCIHFSLFYFLFSFFILFILNLINVNLFSASEMTRYVLIRINIYFWEIFSMTLCTLCCFSQPCNRIVSIYSYTLCTCSESVRSQHVACQFCSFSCNSFYLFFFTFKHLSALIYKKFSSASRIVHRTIHKKMKICSAHQFSIV